MMTYSKKRIEALQERLEQEGLDGLLLATGASFAYLLDMASLPFQRTSETKNQRGAPSIEALNVPDCLLYIPREGEGRIVCVPWRERDLQCAPVPVEVTYLDVFSERMRRHIRGKRIAVGDCCGPWLSEFLKSVAPDIESVPGEKMVEELRRYKDDKEIALLQQAAGMTDAVMGRVVANLKPGVTSYEVEEMLVEFGREAGAEDLAFGPAAMFTLSGHPSAQTLGGCPKDTPLASGCSLAFDFGYILKGYCSDFGRSFYCGRAPELIRDGYAALQAAQCSMIERLVPGQTNIKDIDGMIRDELTRMGASIKVEGNTAIIDGVDGLTGARVSAPDLRAGAALVIAGLAAEGITIVDDIIYIQRGYEDFEGKLRGLGAEIQKVSSEREIQKFKLQIG